MKTYAVIAAVLAVLGHAHATVGHVPVLWLVLLAELAAGTVLVILIRRAARWRMRSCFA